MPRPTKHKIKFDEHTLNLLYQEVYNESHNLRNKLARILSKWEGKVKEDGHIATLGDTIVKVIGLEMKNQDQKIVLLKVLSDIVYNLKNKTDKDSKGDQSEGLTETRKKQLMKIVNEKLENNLENN